MFGNLRVLPVKITSGETVCALPVSHYPVMSQGLPQPLMSQGISPVSHITILGMLRNDPGVAQFTGCVAQLPRCVAQCPRCVTQYPGYVA